MEYFVYIIYSVSRDKYYVGSTQNIESRIRDHNNSRSKYTKGTKDWELVWSKSFEDRATAVKFESSLKKKKSRKYIEWLIEGEN